MEDPGDQEQREEHRETAAQPARRATPTQARGREDAATPPVRNTPPVRRRGTLPPTRRETESEMSGAVSGLLGILQSHQTLITRQLQDEDRGHIMEQYKSHITSLQCELEAVHGHYRDKLKMMHEMHRGEIDQLRAQHHQSVGQLQNMMQQMHQQSKELLKLQAHPCFHTVMSLLPYLEKVPSQNMMACHSTLLDTIKRHMDTPLLQPPIFRPPQPTAVPPWQSSQMYTGYRGSQYGPPLSGSSSSTTSTQESPDFQAATPTFSSSGADQI
ncbi:uncharacterized protein [Hyperolius riggenbachi]|uniref:uncharacterized protein n=1 Tax=Hyperolius riggenbachi TaxID=752182 RepID=UPI0035A2EF88